MPGCGFNSLHFTVMVSFKVHTDCPAVDNTQPAGESSLHKLEWDRVKIGNRGKFKEQGIQ
jgi:hypothetical protein